MIIAIDFDGTIVENIYPSIGKPMEGSIEAINNLYNDGHYIIIYTCRGGSELNDVYTWCDVIGLRYHKINENAPHSMIGFAPFPKLYADVYIDDRNLGGLPSWGDIYKMISYKI